MTPTNAQVAAVMEAARKVADCPFIAWYAGAVLFLVLALALAEVRKDDARAQRESEALARMARELKEQGESEWP
jgi:membrane protein implicated in regulation of membrane protease activity